MTVAANAAIAADNAIRAGEKGITIIPVVGMGTAAGYAAGELADGRKVLCVTATASTKTFLQEFLASNFPDRSVAGYGSALANIGLATIADTRKIGSDILDIFDLVVFDEIYPSQHSYITPIAYHFMRANKPIVHVKGVGQPGLLEGGTVLDLRTMSSNAEADNDAAFRRSAADIEALIDDTAKSLEREPRGYGILFENDVVEGSLADFVAWVQGNNGTLSTVAVDTVEDIEIVTQFVAGLARRRDGSVIPQFETFVGNGDGGSIVETYHTLAEAREGHMKIFAEKFVSAPAP